MRNVLLTFIFLLAIISLIDSYIALAGDDRSNSWILIDDELLKRRDPLGRTLTPQPYTTYHYNDWKQNVWLGTAIRSEAATKQVMQAFSEVDPMRPAKQLALSNIAKIVLAYLAKERPPVGVGSIDIAPAVIAAYNYALTMQRIRNEEILGTGGWLSPEAIKRQESRAQQEIGRLQSSFQKNVPSMPMPAREVPGGSGTQQMRQQEGNQPELLSSQWQSSPSPPPPPGGGSAHNVAGTMPPTSTPSQGKPGGVTMDMSQAFVDRGDSHIITPFGLLYGDLIQLKGR